MTVLRTAENFADELDDREIAPARAIPLRRSDEPHVAASGGRYGEQRRLSLPATVLTVALHLLLLAGLLGLQYRAEARKEERLVSINLASPPPAPPASPEKPVPQKASIQAPTPLIRMSQAAPPIATSPDPVPDAPAPPVAAPAPQAAPAPPSIVQSNDLGTRMVSGRPPRYPRESRRAQEQGTVVLFVTLDVGGGVASISIQRSSGFPRLDDAARDAVRTWRWAPTIRNGVAVKAQGIIPIPFVLQLGEGPGRRHGGGRHRGDGDRERGDRPDGGGDAGDEE